MKPGRTDAGYRVYLERDLETLEQIVALRFLGFPLKQIGVVLNRAREFDDFVLIQPCPRCEFHGLAYLSPAQLRIKPRRWREKRIMKRFTALLSSDERELKCFGGAWLFQL